ncbi:hypothetical protein N9H93_01775 [Rhizobiaceae bacterium]|nr:hypothetical protein [Rhizobiaceae bacterium]
MLNRRGFVLGSLLLTAGSATAALPLIRSEATLIGFLNRNLGLMQVTPDELHAFTRALLSDWKLTPARRRAVLFFIEHPSALSLVPSRLRAAQDRKERWILTKFLTSTNVFEDGNDLAQAEYVAFSDPYEMGCANPLARFDTAAA